MGTVGLSFGSPTSGTGFDVSATVAQIVGNLRNVETPWKNQLTSLQSQDTAISKLGTLMSTVSTDLSQLTDLTGIMAQKTGSSSNTNVLTLTSATSSAVAGTHTVTVKNLATSASGYLDSISNVSDALSGSITIKVGSGTAQTIALGSKNNTLAGLAAAINQAGVGVTASVLTDASGSRLSLVSGASGAGGQIAVTSNITDTTNANTALGYNSSVTGKDASLVVDGVNLTSSSNTVTGLIPGLTFQLLSPSSQLTDGSYVPVQVVIGNDVTSAGSAVNAFVSDYNALVSAINAQDGYDSSGNAEPLFGSPTLSLLQQQLMAGINVQNPSGTLDPVSTNLGARLSGSITIQMGSGTAQTIALDSSDNTLEGLAQAINDANLGVKASIKTTGNQATLALLSQTAGAAGVLTVSSNLSATSNTLLDYRGTPGSSTTTSSGKLNAIANGSDTLSGSISIQVGNGAKQTIAVDPGNNTLAGLVATINNANAGVTASVVTNSDGSQSLALVSGTAGSAGTLSVTSNILDTSDTRTNSLSYANSSDLSTLANLGVTLSSNYDGTLSLDSATLYSALNADFSGVAGFFQNGSSWGVEFGQVLKNAGISSTRGILALAKSSNSSNESMLNADISREESLISAQQKSLTAELISANEILQQIPSQLSQVNMIYSAITGYKGS